MGKTYNEKGGEKTMEKKKSKKSSKPKEDLKAVALLHLAQKYYKIYSLYSEELISYLSKGKSKKIKDDVEDSVWNSVMEQEDYETFNEAIKRDNGKR